jgi:hypothetical protein
MGTLYVWSRKWTRIGVRLFASTSATAFTFLAIPIAVLALVTERNNSWNPQNDPHKSELLFITLMVIIGVAVVAWLSQTYSEYQRRAYDSNLAVKYWDMWLKAKDRRRTAAHVLQLRRNELTNVVALGPELEPIDDVLDILEDLGFYVHGARISPEVAHHFFYHWIRGYWFAATPYISAKRNLETRAWEHVNKLVDQVSQVEREQHGARLLVLNEEQIANFLAEEERPDPEMPI